MAHLCSRAISVSCQLVCGETKSSWCGGGSGLPVKHKLNNQPQRWLGGACVHSVVRLLCWKLCKQGRNAEDYVGAVTVYVSAAVSGTYSPTSDP